MKRTAIYPGSFDPLTLGHLNIIERGAQVFDEITVAVARKVSKSAIFPPGERVKMVTRAVKGIKNVKVESFEGLLMDYASKKKVKTVLRGMRSVSDFEYELQMATANKTLNPGIETVFMVTDAKYSHISSSLIKEIVTLGGETGGLIPPFVEKKLREKLLGK